MRRRDTSRPASGRRAIKRKVHKARARVPADERSTAGGKSNKRAKLLRRNTAKSARNQRSSTAGQEIDVVRLARERDEALKQQAATAEVLKALSRSTFDLQSVLENLLEKAVRLCDAERGLVYKQDGDVYRVAASYGHSNEFLENVIKQNPIHRDRSSATGRAVVERRVVHIHDILTDSEYHWAKDQHSHEGMHRTILAVPMLNGDTIIGVIAIRRTQVQPFTAKQIELLTTFAAQAVIAIENTRLLNELRQRTSDLTESLEQQTATSKVLEVISRSAFDLQAMFETVAKSSVKLCGADRAFIFRFDGELLRMVVAYNSPPAFKEWVAQHPIRPGRHSGSARAALERRTIHITDVQADPEYTYGAKDAEAIRTILGVPILKGESLLGVMMIYRLEVKPFNDKQIALVETFADQAAIAIDNVQLFEAEEQRTHELSKSLDQQTATAEILKVISSSPGDLKPVFVTILDKALHLCEAVFGFVATYDGERFERAAQRGVPDALAAYFRTGMDQPRPGDAHWRLVAGEDLIHNLDQMDEDAYRLGNPLRQAVVDLGGARSALVVALRKDKVLLGALTVYRKEVRPFTDQQVSLLQNFAAQAVIAIENARLLNELRQSLQQQIATADVLKVISRSAFDLQTVLQTLVASAVRLCDAEKGAITRQKDGVFYRAESSPLNLWIMSGVFRSNRNAARPPDGLCSKAKRFILPMCELIPNTISRRRDSIPIVRPLAFRCCARASRSAF
jgi:two-component system, NtrC family, sensor kinase